MDEVDVHRIRFIEHVPLAIQCLSFLDDGSKLALSRGDGSIEVWRSRSGTFFKEVWIPGKTNTTIEALQWCEARLFSGSLSGLLEEWDLILLQPSQSVISSGGPIWCLQVSNDKSFLATGCENGQVHMYDIRDGGLVLMRYFQSIKVRIISLAWHPCDSYLAVGGADGVIRKISVASGCCILEIQLDDSLKPIIWDLKYIDSFIVSADSRGKVIIWNDKFGTVFQSFGEHSADVLALAVNSTQDTIYSSGIDQRILVFKRITEKGEWIKGKELKIHSHDVRALDVSSDGFLASGGVDTHLFISDTNKFKPNSCVKYAQWQDSSKFFSVASEAGVIMHQCSNSLQLWRFSVKNQHNDNMPVNFLEIKSKGVNSILSSAISSDATRVALSTVKYFWLYDFSAMGPKPQCLQFSNLPCYKLQFCCEDTLLVQATIKEGLKVWNMKTDQCITFNKDSGDVPITDFCCNDEGSLILVRKYSGDVYLYDLRKGIPVRKVPGMTFPFYLFFSSRSAQLYSQERTADETVLFVSSFGSKEIIVIEQLLSNAVSKLPQVFYKDRYGS